MVYRCRFLNGKILAASAIMLLFSTVKGGWSCAARGQRRSCSLSPSSPCWLACSLDARLRHRRLYGSTNGFLPRSLQRRNDRALCGAALALRASECATPARSFWWLAGVWYDSCIAAVTLPPACQHQEPGILACAPAPGRQPWSEPTGVRP